MSSKRSYQDGCAAAHALDLVGERWALLIIRELLLGPRRFTDLRTGLPHVSPNVLSQRLSDLETHGILKKHKLPPPAATHVYELTPYGQALEPVIRQLVLWGIRSPDMPYDAPLGASPLILTMRTMFNPAKHPDLTATYQLHVNNEPFQASLKNSTLTLTRGYATNPDAVITGDSDTLKRLTFGGRSVQDALTAGTITIEGDISLATAFLSLFKLPDKQPS